MRHSRSMSPRIQPWSPTFEWQTLTRPPFDVVPSPDAPRREFCDRRREVRASGVARGRAFPYAEKHHDLSEAHQVRICQCQSNSPVFLPSPFPSVASAVRGSPLTQGSAEWKNGTVGPGFCSRSPPHGGEVRRCQGFPQTLFGGRRDGSGSLVLPGVFGIGKTALVEYMATAARDIRGFRSTGVGSEMVLTFAHYTGYAHRWRPGRTIPRRAAAEAWRSSFRRSCKRRSGRFAEDESEQSERQFRKEDDSERRDVRSCERRSS
jgi:hypothetical protein